MGRDTDAERLSVAEKLECNMSCCQASRWVRLWLEYFLSQQLAKGLKNNQGKRKIKNYDFAWRYKWRE